MRLEIVTPDKKIYEGEVKLIKLPGKSGSFEILNNHAPIISMLEKGEIKIIETTGDVNFFQINGGVVECSHNKIIVLAE